MVSNLLAQASHWLKLTDHNLYFGSSFAFFIASIAMSPKGGIRKRQMEATRSPSPKSSRGTKSKTTDHRGGIRRRIHEASSTSSAPSGSRLLESIRRDWGQENCLRNKSWTTCAEQKNKGPQGCRAWPRRTTRIFYIGLYLRPSANRKGRQISCGWTCRRQRV